ncbi:hypothetical protein Mnod_4077 [Methylobacterium nodulans ORS 2060]|uniref:Uncharacterized protein n=1 Tax=Methylobacterium nodulans (strain LMG 21967 / CNCM I-2342 / ORS 2060) TaxID=460265 RepID=B8ITP0_METNO|nr:hypothetical protein Mnod_4077 [Methylobacterium nodulans ORS 2060]
MAAAVDEGARDPDAVPAGRPVLRNGDLADGLRDRLLDRGRHNGRVEILAILPVRAVAPRRAVLRPRNRVNRPGHLFDHRRPKEVRIEVAAVPTVAPILAIAARLTRSARRAVDTVATILARASVGPVLAVPAIQASHATDEEVLAGRHCQDQDAVLGEDRLRDAAARHPGLTPLAAFRLPLLQRLNAGEQRRDVLGEIALDRPEDGLGQEFGITHSQSPLPA